MTKNIDFYFDFISPYTYIGYKRLKQERKKFNFTYKPILLGGLHKLWGITPQASIESKKKFMIMDCEIVTKKLKIDFKFNSKFPVNSIKLMRGCLILNKDQLNKYIELVFDAYWKNNKDVSDDNIISELLKKIEINIDDFNKKIDDPNIKEKLKNLTTDAYKQNIFGAPTYVINNKIFWGQDRFEYVIDELNFTS
tara:strand:+ start:324 stop:908 length:585 start_codon:yes stop_codon:yes gene_type:complete